MSATTHEACASSAATAVPRWACRALEGVQDEVARHLVADAISLRLPRGARIGQTGEPGTAEFFVESGTARVEVHGCESWAGVALLGPGDLVGELTAAYSGGRAATVTCLEAVELACVARAVFDTAKRLDARFGANVVRMRNAALAATQWSFAALRWLEVDRRVARELLALAECYGVREPNGSVRIPLRLTQHDLAILACASRERTNRALSAFRRRGWLHVDRARHMTLSRPDLLRKRLHSPA